MSSPTRAPSRATKSSHVGMARYVVTVARKELLSPHMVRITFAGEDLRTFRDDGPDQRFKLMLPRPGQERPVLPDAEDWYPSWLAMPTDVRPILRTYTVRRSRPHEAELDVDFLLHDPSGPASQWAATVTPGREVALQGAWAEYEVPAGTQRQLIAGDHTALPAIAAIGEQLEDGAAVDLLVEVTSAEDILDLELPAGVEVRWLVQGEVPGAALRAAVEELDGGWDYAWVCADKGTAATLRRHLVDHRGLRPPQIMFMGYWRTDGAIDD